MRQRPHGLEGFRGNAAQRAVPASGYARSERTIVVLAAVLRCRSHCLVRRVP